jgi:serine/threonine-protein kinase 24/25/MST4
MGSFRNMANDLVRPGVIPDEDEEAVSLFGTAEDGDSLDTDAAMKGSDIQHNPGGTGSGIQAQNTTVVVRSQLASQPGRVVPTEEVSPSDTCSTDLTDSNVNPDLGAPPAYVRTPRRSSYAARMAPNGTIVREADIGTGVDTIRPVKKIDTTGSLRLSSEFVGSIRARDGSGAGSVPTSPTSPVKDKSSHKRSASETAKAARSLVDEVVLPTLQKVGYPFIRSPWQGVRGGKSACVTDGIERLLPMIWTHARSNPSACYPEASKSYETSTLNSPST